MERQAARPLPRAPGAEQSRAEQGGAGQGRAQQGRAGGKDDNDWGEVCHGQSSQAAGPDWSCAAATAARRSGPGEGRGREGLAMWSRDQHAGRVGSGRVGSRCSSSPADMLCRRLAAKVVGVHGDIV